MTRRVTRWWRIIAFRMECCTVSNADNLTRKLTAARDYYESGEQRAHLVWYYKELMSRVRISDLETGELAALVAVLVGAHARTLAAADGPEPPSGVFVLPPVGSALSDRRLRSVAN